MNKTIQMVRADFLSPKYLILRALVLSLVFLIVHSCGLREYATFLSGTVPYPEVSMKLASFYGMLYIVCYIGLIVLVPILLLAAGILALGQKVLKSSQHAS